jgi:hypothetical protein
MNGNGNTNTAEKIASSSNGNEILRALLLFEQIPNHPTISKLTSLSQVGYSLGVPIFWPPKLPSRVWINSFKMFASRANVVQIPKRTNSEQQITEEHACVSAFVGTTNIIVDTILDTCS